MLLSVKFAYVAGRSGDEDCVKEEGDIPLIPSSTIGAAVFSRVKAVWMASLNCPR